MVKNNDDRDDGIIKGFSSVKEFLLETETGATGEGGASDDVGPTRRSYLAGVGTAAAALAGCTGRTGGTDVNPVTVFNYGGGAAIYQSEKISTAITESESNDTQQNATSVALGTRIDGTLQMSDSDWYALELSSGQRMAVTFQRSPQTGVTAVIAYDADGDFTNLRYVSTDEAVTFEVTAETTGTYHVQVVDTQSSDGAYTLSLESASASESTETDSGTETPTSPSVEDDYGTQRYGEYGYGGIKA